MRNLLLYLLLLFTIPATSFADATKTVGASGADYSTLKAAFDAINAGSITGVITLQIIDNTTETASAVLNASGSGSASYTSITIYPTVTGKTISGSLAAPLISLNGADNVTIDGRLNATGSSVDLTITNTSTSSTSFTSTIRFINDATTNTIKYCTIKGSSTSTTGGIIYFATATSGTIGNDANTIDSNNITSDAAGRPLSTIFSAGTSGKANSEVVISNNSIYNFLKHGSTSYGINLGTQTSAWTISGNSFYETSAFTPTAAVDFYVIRINNGSGTGFNVSDNFIGGSSSSCGGTWTKNNDFNNIFYGIFLNVGDVVVSNINNNTIKNFTWGNAGSAAWTAIHLSTGAVNVGTSSGNTIGSSTGTGSVTVNGGATGTIVYGINIASTGTVDCRNNTIGSITATNSSTDASSIIGINKVTSAGTTTIVGNTIGSSSQAGSINASSASSGNTQDVIGILNYGTGDISVSNNLIANLQNATTNTAGVVTGIYFEGSTGTNFVNSNFIHSLTASGGSSTAVVYGIRIVAGITTYYNNIVTLGGNTSTEMYGIYETGSVDETYMYFNTVYITGAPTSGSQNSYAVYNNQDSNVRDFTNNIFVSVRSNSGASGSHYAISLAGNSLTIDYNDYFVSGSGSVLGYLGGNKTTLALWKTATGQDVNSLNTDPLFTSGGSTTATDYKVSASLSGLDGTGITTDYGLNSRGPVPTIGAWESGDNKWKGTSSSNWGTATNWTFGVVPDLDANIIFDDAPLNNLVLDIDRSVTDITINQGTYRIVTNGKKLTVKGTFYLTNNAKIDASATSSTLEFSGSVTQSIPNNSLYNNKVYNLIINKPANNVNLYDSLIIDNLLTVSSTGRLNAYSNTPTIIYDGSSAQTIEYNKYYLNRIYNLTISNSSGVTQNATGFTVTNNLNIDASAIYTITAGCYLTVTNTFTNGGTINLRSGSGGTASLIAGSASGGTTNMERYMTGGSGNVWHNLSSPVSGYSISSFISAPGNSIPTKGSSPTLYGMEFYNETSGNWTYYSSANIGSAGNFLPGSGYLTRRSSSGVVTFTGTLNSGTINQSITKNHFGWNAIGNPYSSSIGFNSGTTATNFLGSNSSNLDPSFVAGYFWSGTSYVVRNNASAATYIQPGQGFVVKSKVGGATVSFAPGMQTHVVNPTFYKKSSEAWSEITLYVDNSKDSATTNILFRDDMTRGLDISYDGGILLTDSMKIALYSRLVNDNGVNFAIQCLPSNETDSMMVPIGLESLSGGTLHFHADINFLPAGYSAILEDKLTGSFTDLSLWGSEYSTDVEPGYSGTGRFFLHIIEGSNNIEPHERTPFTAYTVKKDIYVKGIIQEGAKLEIYDLLGRKIEEKQLVPGLNIIHAGNLTAGVYIARISDNGITRSSRIPIREL
jgi:hypothetical protein